jgi:ubiquitin-protein ligase E3 A
MRALAHKTPTDYKKPLKVHFHGEKGVDAGGLRKEFFQLIIGELFDVRYGMFLTDEETHTFRFNPDSLDSPLEFELIGVLIGIAIYNNTILDLHLPRVIYKQLLGMKPTLDDLVESQPSLGKGLMQLLEFDGDVEATFARDFTLTVDSWGEQKIVELKPGGADIPVTSSNRHEFVDLYVEYILEKSISKQFTPFKKGFMRACGGEALKLFRPFELELLVCGSQEFDFEALQSTTRYEDGYTEDSDIIKWFCQRRTIQAGQEQQKLAGSGQPTAKHWRWKGNSMLTLSLSFSLLSSSAAASFFLFLCVQGRSSTKS